LNLTQNQSLVSKTTSETKKEMEWNFFVWIAFSGCGDQAAS
jgi:hypothetical protein